MLVSGGPSSSSALLSVGGQEAVLRVDPAFVPVLDVKLGALVVLLIATLLFGFAPLCIVRGAGHVRRRWLSLISCFAGGVFLATCLLDLLPDYLQGISGLNFPLPEFIVAMGFFLVLVLEQIVLDFKDRSSSQQEEGHHHHRRGSVESEGHLHADLDSQSALRAFILVFSLSLHSVFEGLAVGLLEEDEEILEICLALLIHKSIISFSLSFQLSQNRLRRSVVSGCVLLFAVMSPLGIALGVGLTETKTSPRHQLACSSLEGLATGTFIYITFMEILPHELSSTRSRIPKVAMMLLGFAVVTAVLFIKL
uniref:Solute carrier family 39 member 1 n=1 Tax=Kryptolebias marmoratus TaxID=37003 RepID=A0A3Q3B8G5_KRYMA